MRAAAITWDGGSHNFMWSTANNWSGNVEPAGVDTLTFPATVPDYLATIILSNGEAAHRMIFNNNYELTGGSLDLGINAPFTFNPRITTAPGTSVFIDTTMTGAISGYGLEKYGSGTLTLLGTNTFVGSVYLVEGILAINSDAALGGANNTVAFIGSNATLNTTASFSTSRNWFTTGTASTINIASGTVLSLSGTLGGAQSPAIRKSGGGTLTLALGNTQQDLLITLQEGMVRLAVHSGAGPAATVSGSAGTTVDLAGFNQVMYLDGGTSVINSGVATSTLSSAGNMSGTISGNIALTVAGFMVLQSANSYSGGTTVNAGRVAIAADNRLGVAGTLLTLNGGGLRATESYSTSRPLVFGAGGAEIAVDASKNLSLTGSITGGGALNKTGAGTLVLGGSGASGHGTTTVTEGTLMLVKASPGTIAAPADVIIGDGIGTDLLTLSQSEQIADAANVTIASSGIFSMGTSTETIAGLTMTGGQVSGTAAATLKVMQDVTLNASTLGAIISPRMDLVGVAHLFTVPDSVAAVDLRLSGEVVNGDLVKIGPGRMDAKRFRDLGALTVLHGTVRMLDDGGVNGVSVIGSFSRSGSAKLDLRNNMLIVRSGSVGSWNGSAYTGLSGHIASAFHGGAWDGAGITTSMPDAATGLTALAIATAGQAGYAGGLFGGVSVSAGDVLIMYTYAGDANLDGFISGDDYTAIDFNVAVPGASGWFNGDFNYDGIISGDDYAAIDFNIVAQGAPFPRGCAAELSGVTAVPEPAAVTCTLLLSAPAIAGRRRRMRRGE